MKRKSFPYCRNSEYQDVFLFLIISEKNPFFPLQYFVLAAFLLSEISSLHFDSYPCFWWHGHWLQGSRVYPLPSRAASIKPPQLYSSKAWWNILLPDVGINPISELRQIPLPLCNSSFSLYMRIFLMVCEAGQITLDTLSVAEWIGYYKL